MPFHTTLVRRLKQTVATFRSEVTPFSFIDSPLSLTHKCCLQSQSVNQSVSIVGFISSSCVLVTASVEVSSGGGVDEQ